MNSKATVPAGHPRPCARLLPTLAILLCIVLPTLAGCSQPGQPTSAASANTTEAQATTAAQTTQASSTVSTTSGTSLVTTALETEPASGFQPFSADDLTIVFQGTTAHLLEDASPLLASLGDVFQFSEAESCVYEGMDKTFDYGHAVVYTIPSSDLDLLDGVDFLDAQVATARGIRVGDSRESVLAVYGPQAGSDSDLVYNGSGDSEKLAEPRLSFIMDGDTVLVISYYSGSNAQG